MFFYKIQNSFIFLRAIPEYQNLKVSIRTMAADRPYNPAKVLQGCYIHQHNTDFCITMYPIIHPVKSRIVHGFYNCILAHSFQMRFHSFSTSFISPFSNVMMATLFCGSL